MATRKQYAGAAVQTTITSSLSAVATTVDIASTTGWPSGATPYFVVISPGTTSEEKCLVTRASSTLTLTRGQDGTSGQSHSSGAVIYPVFTATDADEANSVAAKMTRAYKVGDTGPGGGIVFFVDYQDEHVGFNFLEIAPFSTEVNRTWAPSTPVNYQSTTVSGADSTALGAGYQNTIDIVAQGHTDASTSAAKYCDALSSGGQTDWYLPSLGELILAHEVLNLYLGVGDFGGSTFWSSTENASNSARHLSFTNGVYSVSTKGNSLAVRPVRRFS